MTTPAENRPTLAECERDEAILSGRACEHGDEDHEKCEVCGAYMCEYCSGLDEPLRCADDATRHCIECLSNCGPCQSEAAREFQAEQKADILRFGY